ncbi:DUF3857 domain-containing protein [Flagellimonas algicola]|uniref:DUF3857 domain-containing protein n=1 Tax=Flagellimonas algicola TaxID=2583815 RepID=A0ABY2WR15_9FLAO|nr:DUF3857 domain-containing protein [Allomuricauda algicola]TMU57433.1 DUF3857 domain-containing protein [Allomuricauda algicola]
MNLKKLALGLIWCYSIALFGQDKHEFGQLNKFEINFTEYPQDTTAHAIVLHERGEDRFAVINKRIQLVKKYHVKIKILDQHGFDQADISIRYYHTDQAREKVRDIRAITHNGVTKFWLKKDNIYVTDLTENWSEMRFTFPNVKEGSILEYEYELVSPYLFNLTGWSFQGDIPKVRSEFYAEIPGNYVYNRSFVGTLNLDVNESTIKKSCFKVPGYAVAADCEVIRYAIKDIPAFKEDEDYMLAASNYISRIDFEMSQHTSVNGNVENYTKSWKDVDREFRTDKDIGRQLTKQSFFGKNVPQMLFEEPDSLKRAMGIYDFVQNHFTWNNKYSIHKGSRVKSAFEKQMGSVGEINLTLINLLQLAGLKTDIVLMSTRKNGLPKRTHPVMSDFNYLIAIADIGGTSYVLDATDKYIPFGMLPFRCLNYYGRVMDFKNGSYWLTINPVKDNTRIVRGRVLLDMENNRITGDFKTSETGYFGVSKQKTIQSLSEDDYLIALEKKFSSENEGIISEYTNLNKVNSKSKVVEKFKLEWEQELNREVLYINPFFIRFFVQNPFVLEERNYPIDFGHPRIFTYQVTIQIPEGYSLVNLPENKAFALPENSGYLKLQCSNAGSFVTVLFNLKIDHSYYKSEHYNALKELFRNAVDIQKNTMIKLTKN